VDRLSHSNRSPASHCHTTAYSGLVTVGSSSRLSVVCNARACCVSIFDSRDRKRESFAFVALFSGLQEYYRCAQPYQMPTDGSSRPVRSKSSISSGSTCSAAPSSSHTHTIRQSCQELNLGAQDTQERRPADSSAFGERHRHVNAKHVESSPIEFLTISFGKLCVVLAGHVMADHSADRHDRAS
jgi:hypothetical protein